VPFRAHDVAEAILPDTRAGVECHPVADQSMRHRGTGTDIAVVPDEHAVADNGARGNCRACADSRLAPNDCARLDRDTFSDFGGGVDELIFSQGRRCGRLRLERRRIEKPDGHGEGAVGRVRDDRGDSGGHEAHVTPLDETGACVGRDQIFGVFGTGAKGQMCRRSSVQRAQVINLGQSVAGDIQLSTDSIGETLQGNGIPAQEKSRVLHSSSNAEKQTASAGASSNIPSRPRPYTICSLRLRRR